MALRCEYVGPDRVYNSRVKNLRVALPLGLLFASAGSLFPQNLEKLDPAIDQIVPANLVVEKVASGFNKWTEGPVWTRSNMLLFAEIPGNSIIQWAPGQSAKIFIHPSGYTGSEPFKGGEPGSNGMTLDARGRLTVAGHARRNVWRLESLSPDAPVTVLADTFEGKALNSPNDLAYRKDGSLYFTDPPYGLPTQSDQDPGKRLQVNGVYRVLGARDQKPGAAPDHTKIQLLIKDLPRPNGIAFSPDEKILYVANSGPKRFWMRYDLKPDGTPTNGTVLYDASSEKANGAPDGLKVDQKGNMYSSGPGGVWIFSPAGKHIGTIRTPERAGNVAWGDADGKTLYVTASTSIYKIRLNIAGVKP